MISTKTSVDVFIDDVAEIRTDPVSNGFYGKKERFITVETNHGELYCLHLNAQDAKALQIRELPDIDDHDWLTPKLYKGSRAELEEDQPDAE